MLVCGFCGYPNDEADHRCEQCGRRFDLAADPDFRGDLYDGSEVEALPAPRPTVTPTVATAPEFDHVREEVSSRVEQFRQRRRQLALDFASTPAPTPKRSPKIIPFPEKSEPHAVAAGPAPPSAPAPSNSQSASLKPPLAARNPQLPLSFAERRPAPVEALSVSVAPLAARIIAGGADAALAACGCALFFTVYGLAGGKFPPYQLAFAIEALAAVMVVFAYFAMAILCTAATPGMRWVGLRLVDFDGRPAPLWRRKLRLLGLAASISAVGAGFLWALVDEDRLTWHDRISRTCLTMRG